MPEESKHGTPIPPGQNPAGQGPQVECVAFEALLMDALDGQLTGTRREAFDAHRRVCAVCGPMFAEVDAGRLWLRSLQPVEPPVHLAHNILVATSGVVSTRRVRSEAGRATPFVGRVRQWWESWLAPTTTFVRQPRFVMSFGMIFFSFSLALSVAGVKASDVAKISFRPAALRHAYNEAQIRLVKYYDNIRFVYEIESKVRQLRESTAPAEPNPQPKRQNRNSTDTSGQPEQRQDRNYSHEQTQTVLARLTEQPDQVSIPPAPRFYLPSASESVLARSSKLAAQGLQLADRSSQLAACSYSRRFV